MDFNEVMDRVSLVIEKKLGMKPKDNVIAKYLDISTFAPKTKQFSSHIS